MTALMALGRRWSGAPLFPPRAEEQVVQSLLGALGRNVGAIRAAQGLGLESVSRKSAGAGEGEVRHRVVDRADPRQVGWCLLHHADDPLVPRYLEVMRPLAELRGMGPDVAPLVFHGEPPDRWLEWLIEHYQGRSLDGGRVPEFVLILGGPAQVPFGLQALLQTVASVGRLAPDRIEDLQAYVDKVLRLERAEAPAVSREVLFFATDEGRQDPTHFSREYMVSPLAAHVRDDLQCPVHVLDGERATKAELAAVLRARRPALVYTASHGLGAIDEPLEFQQQYNGAICCRHDGPMSRDALFSAEDVPADGAFLEGAVFFQFACFGYGTPAESDYAHWLDGYPETNAPSDFVAALPRRLLAHPRGPIAYIGHVDTAFLHGFTDAANPQLATRWNVRMAPFKDAVDGLLRVEPSGLVMESMRERYSAANAALARAYDNAQRQKAPWSADKQGRFLDTWIMRGDAQNFMVMGDPAAVLRIPSP